jgi:hypothetical protein
MTSGCRSANSIASTRIRSTLFAHRASIREFPPLIHPSCASPWMSTDKYAFVSGSLSADAISTPIRSVRARCCAGRHERPGCTAPEPRNELPPFCMKRKEHSQGDGVGSSNRPRPDRKPPGQGRSRAWRGGAKRYVALTRPNRSAICPQQNHNCSFDHLAGEGENARRW